ncbi:CvpA family protein [Acetobacteraceae bacterium ESL0709]|nr:CvpA family protein [Acetobacteraceae bacterium ESL0697]MDF7677556.1 CvpA family protein [Acetobacteraceae bacterium ESL0709]
MDEDPPPPTDHGTPEEALSSSSGSASSSDAVMPAGAATGGHDAVAAHGSVGAGASGAGDGVHFLDQFHNLTSFDTGCLMVIGFSLLSGLMRGGSKEITGILVWVGALWLSLRASNAAMAWANPSLPENLQNSNIALWGARIVVFVIGVIVFSALVDRVSYMARSNLSRSFDTLLGFAFGAIRGYALLVVFCLAASWASSNWIASITQGSIMMPYITKGMQILQGYVPASLQSYLALPDTNTLQDTQTQ